MSNVSDIEQLADNDDVNVEIQPHLGRLDFVTNNAYAHDNLAFTPETEESSEKPTRTISINGNANNAPVPTLEQTATNGDVLTSHPVYYNRYGQSVVNEENIVIQQPDGTRVIETERCRPEKPYRPGDKPLTKKHIRLIRAFSIVALIVFFPTGIPAVYYAFKVEKEFNAGILLGNIDKARSFSKKAERLIIFSALLAIMTVVIVFSIVERVSMSPDDLRNNAIITNRLLPG